MIDLHCHILPGVDDGPVNMDFSLAMARAAVSVGTETVVATPHIRSDYDLDPDGIDGRVEELADALRAAGIPLSVLAGGEVAAAKAHELDDSTLTKLCLGSSSCILIETPLSRDSLGFEESVAELRARGFVVLLAHPERSPIFQRDPERIRALVHGGALCSVTASSLPGLSGRTARRLALRLIREGLVHNVTSDAHDHLHRPPLGLRRVLEDADHDVPGLGGQASWLTTDVPRALLADEELPPRPSRAPGPPRWYRFPARSA